MCSIVLRIGEDGVFIGANRDEMIDRPWSPPAEHWPGVVAGQDRLAGGTWAGMNRAGVVAAVLNRHGSLGPAAGKRSRGELPLLALVAGDAQAAATFMAGLNAAMYRSFNLVVADAGGAFFLRGLEAGAPECRRLPAGTWMITSGEPNERASARIARHLPRFEAADFADWPTLLADTSGPAESAMNILPHDGFGTVCSSVIALPRGGPPSWLFAAGPPDVAAFVPVATL